MAGQSRRSIGVPAAVLVGSVALVVAVAAVGVVAAVPIAVAVDAPGTATPGGEVEVTYELTNDGDEPTSALGLNVTVPEAFETTEIRTDEGSPAERRDAVFWIDPVDPGETVSATFVVAIDDDAGGEYALEATVSSSTTTELAATTIDVDEDGGTDETTGDDTGDSSGDDGGSDGTATEESTSTDDADDGDDAAAASAGDSVLPVELRLVGAAGVGVLLVLVGIAAWVRRG